MRNNRFVFMVPYAYDHITGNVPSGSAKRCAEALNFACEKLNPASGKLFAVLTAGYSKQNPTEPSHLGDHSLSSEQSAYLKGLGDESVHIVDPSGWGTLDETLHAIRLIEDHVRLIRTFPEDEVHVVVSSNPFHLYGRIALCWHLLRPYGWKVHFAEAHHHFTWKERFQETFLKIPFYMWIVMKEGWKSLASHNPKAVSSR